LHLLEENNFNSSLTWTELSESFGNSPTVEAFDILNSSANAKMFFENQAYVEKIPKRVKLDRL